MLAEAQGNTGTSVGYISQVRVRAGLLPISGAFATPAAFEKELTDQRRQSLHLKIIAGLIW